MTELVQRPSRLRDSSISRNRCTRSTGPATSALGGMLSNTPGRTGGIPGRKGLVTEADADVEYGVRDERRSDSATLAA